MVAEFIVSLWVRLYKFNSLRSVFRARRIQFNSMRADARVLILSLAGIEQFHQATLVFIIA